MGRESIMIIEFTEKIGEHSFEKIAIFNKNKIDEEKAKECVYNQVSNENVIVVYKEQYDNVFNA